MTPETPAFQPVACCVIERNDGQLLRSRLSENVPMIYEPAAVHHWKVASDTIHDAVLIPGTLAAYEQLVQDAARLRWIDGLNLHFEVSATTFENDPTPHYFVTMHRDAMVDDMGQGNTLRDAIDAAMKGGAK